MNEPDREDLLSEVLADAAPAEFRAALLDATLLRVRRQRRWRQTRRAAAVVGALALIALRISRVMPPHPPTTERERSYELVRTQPLPATSVVATKPLAAGQLIASSGNVAIIRTDTAADLQLINDDQLLALAAPRPAALVRLGPASAELVFADAEDENGFPSN